MIRIRATRSKLAATLAAALAGGTLLGTCQTRVRNSVFQGGRDFLSSLPGTILTAADLIDTEGPDATGFP